MPPKMTMRRSHGGRAPKQYLRTRTPPLIEEDYDDSEEDFGEDDTGIRIQGEGDKLVISFIHLEKNCVDSKSLQTSNEDQSGEPLVAISYEDLATNGLDEVVKSLDNKSLEWAILSLKRYLIEKKKGKDKIKSAFSLVPGLKKDEEGDEEEEESLKQNTVKERCFLLKIDKNLLDKLSKTLKDASIFATLKVTGSSNDARGTSTSTKRNGRAARPHPYKRAVEKEINKTEAVFAPGGTAGTGRTILSLLRSSTPSVLTLTAQSEFDVNNFNAGADLQLIINIECEKTPPITKRYLNLSADNTLLAMYKLDDSTKEVTIVAWDGAEIKCHRVVLMANSAVFRSMLSPPQGIAEAPTRIELKEHCEFVLEEFIRFLYGLYIPFKEITFDMALELFKLGNKYQVRKLESNLKHLLCEKTFDCNWTFYSPDKLLTLYFTVRNDECLEELRVHALSELCKLREVDLQGSYYFKNLCSEEKDDLLSKLLEWKG